MGSHILIVIGSQTMSLLLTCLLFQPLGRGRERSESESFRCTPLGEPTGSHTATRGNVNRQLGWVPRGRRGSGALKVEGRGLATEGRAPAAGHRNLQGSARHGAQPVQSPGPRGAGSPLRKEAKASGCYSKPRRVGIACSHPVQHLHVSEGPE